MARWEGKTPNITCEALKYCGQWVSSREGNRERPSRLRDISMYLFHVLFSETRSSGEPHLCNIGWLYNPAHTRGYSHPEHPWLESRTHFSAKFLEAIKQMEKLRGNIMCRELPSHMLWERRILLCSISGLAWKHKCFHWVALWSSHCNAKLQC